MLEIKNLTKKFNTQIAVNNLNLTINTGECFGLLGRNGAGKSTTIKMLVGLMQPDTGEINYDGMSLYANPIEIKKRIAYVPDMPYIYQKMTGLEFMFFTGYMYGIDKKIIQEKAYKFFEMFDFLEMLNRKTEEYSHGMRQKLVFSTALLHQPQYLIIDEPMIGLDPQSAKIIKNILRDISQKMGITIILTTHQLYIAEEICDRIGIIHQGVLKELFHNKNDFKNTLESKFLEITGHQEVDYMSWL